MNNKGKIIYSKAIPGRKLKRMLYSIRKNRNKRISRISFISNSDLKFNFKLKRFDKRYVYLSQDMFIHCHTYKRTWKEMYPSTIEVEITQYFGGYQEPVSIRPWPISSPLIDRLCHFLNSYPSLTEDFRLLHTLPKFLSSITPQIEHGVVKLKEKGKTNEK